MKFRRFISGLLFGCGCALTFAGLFAAVLPTIQNRQIQLVLASFSKPSENTVVSVVNRFMTFALEQGWRMVILGLIITLAGGLLLARFHPQYQNQVQPQSPAKRTEPHYPQPQLSETPVAVNEAPNPFAISFYAEAQPVQQRKANAFIPPSGPMLEKNTFEMQTEIPAAVHAEPYYSPRFEAEVHAVQAEFSNIGQSGSRLLVRPEPVAWPAEPIKEPEPAPAVPMTPVLPAPSESKTASAPLLKPSPRIKSTMGRHSSAAKIRPHS